MWYVWNAYTLQHNFKQRGFCPYKLDLFMKLVIELTESQLHHLESSLFAGKMEAWNHAIDFTEIGTEDKAEIWNRIKEGREEVEKLIGTAIDEQERIGRFKFGIWQGLD